MTTVTFTIPDAQTVRAVDAFSKSYGYRSTLTDGSANPETKAQFMRRMIMEFVMNTVRSAEVSAAAETARVTETAKPGVTVS